MPKWAKVDINRVRVRGCSVGEGLGSISANPQHRPTLAPSSLFPYIVAL